MPSPLVYVAVTVTEPAVVNVWLRVAVADANTMGDVEFRFAAAFGTTATAEPIVVPPAENVTVPVGPAPLLCVAMVAVSVTDVVVVMPVVGEAATVAEVGAAVIVIASAGEVLAVKLLSPA